ncbi:TNF receptor-associated factor 2 [Lingula anatina]|uniref:TNF receptor-associated factor 2 n=1 Tax=Lingula anatina TaxID=7574 RepID=A0A1S3HQA1_LINAN|nr:TNF receptor-associated factor 2 [Lingula anatina]|eukprot:XP_013387716.2 TNF receptor-associated factor 2 [Lingula anatina]
MATGGISEAIRHGYPQSIFVGQSLDKKYLCTHCGEVLNDPIQSFCGHRYCYGCFYGLISALQTTSCQACLSEGEDSVLDKDQTFPDNATRKELDELTVTCSNSSIGCSFKGKFSDFRKNHEKTCEFRQVKCPDCGQEVSPRNLTEHKRDKCPLRSVPCRYCNKTFIAKDNWSHNGICPKFPIRCDFCDNLPRKIPRDKMPDHLKTCRRDKALCKFGCKEKYEVNKEGQHMEQFAVFHLDQVREKMEKLEAEIKQKRQQGEEEHLQALIGRLSILDSNMKVCQAKVADLNQKVTGMSQRSRVEADSGTAYALAAASSSPSIDSGISQIIDQLKTQEGITDSKVNTFEGIVAVLNREVEKCSTQLENYEGQRRLDREALEGNERKIKSLERVIALKDVSMAEQDLRIQALENASFDGILIWKISDFSRKRHDAITGRVTSLYSPSFYTGPHGYKMCCRIYLNGDGMGKGSHVSLFFVVMRGHYDALLRWPFKQKVTFMLLDQNNREHIIDAFRPDPTSSSFKRPTSEMNIASGCPLFMALTQLEKQGTAYVKEDTMFLKVVVDTADL